MSSSVKQTLIMVSWTLAILSWFLILYYWQVRDYKRLMASSIVGLAMTVIAVATLYSDPLH